MGMYNDVWAKCPECDSTLGYMQVPQFVLGSGHFVMGDPDSFLDLTSDEMHDLRAIIEHREFRCQNCEHVFNPFRKRGDSRWVLAAELFTP